MTDISHNTLSKIKNHLAATEYTFSYTCIDLLSIEGEFVNFNY